MSQASNCPTLEELKHYFRVRDIKVEEIRGEIIPVEEHLQHCFECQNQIKEIENAFQEISSTRIIGKVEAIDLLSSTETTKNVGLPDETDLLEWVESSLAPESEFGQKNSSPYDTTKVVQAPNPSFQEHHISDTNILEDFENKQHPPQITNEKSEETDEEITPTTPFEKELIEANNGLLPEHPLKTEEVGTTTKLVPPPNFSDDSEKTPAKKLDYKEVQSPSERNLSDSEIAKLDNGVETTHKLKSKPEKLIIAGCEILGKVGGGGMGDVYKALKLSLNRLVAVKVLRNTEGDPASLAERFSREAMTLAKIDHPNVTQVYDYHISEDQKNYYLIMQYIDGENLEDYIEKEGPLSTEEALPLWYQILEGTQALHEAGILHRDMKPSNILIDTKERIKIVDFGLAKLQTLNDNLTKTNTVIGTPHYMSPEACQAKQQLEPSDIYSLGGVFYYMVTKQTPYKGAIHQLIYHHLHTQITPPQAFVPDFPNSLTTILNKMLSKKLTSRFQSCQEIMQELEHYSSKNKIDLKLQLGSYARPAGNFTPAANVRTQIPSPPTERINLEKESTGIRLQSDLNSVDNQEDSRLGRLNSSSQAKSKTQIKLKQTILLEFCVACEFSKSPSQFFICQKCNKKLCQNHRKGLNSCDSCFSEQYKFNKYYNSIFKALLLKQLQVQSYEAAGKAKFATIANILNALTLNSSENGVLIINNEEHKKGICFLEDEVIILRFGIESDVKIGTLLLQNSRISEDSLSKALNLQKDSQKKLGEILLSVNAISEEGLSDILEEQIRQEIFVVSRWEKTVYKFKMGDIPQNLLETISLDLKLKLEEPVSFKRSLTSMFQHLNLMSKPGVLIIKSDKGSIGLHVKKKKLTLIDFNTTEKNTLGTRLLNAGKINAVQLQEARGQKKLPLESYLVKKGFLTQEELNESQRSYLGKWLFSFLGSPGYRCEFIKIKIFEATIEEFTPLELGIDLTELLYSTLEKTKCLPFSLSFAEIFTLIFEQKSTESIFEVLYQELHQSLILTKKYAHLDEFETAFLMVLLVKSKMLNYLDALKINSIVLSENGEEPDSDRMLECALEIL